MDNGFKKLYKGMSITYFWYYLGSCLKVLRKLRRTSWSPVQDLNLGPPQYEARVLQRQCSIEELQVCHTVNYPPLHSKVCVIWYPVFWNAHATGIKIPFS
jgi:hypothetical protein